MPTSSIRAPPSEFVGRSHSRREHTSYVCRAKGPPSASHRDDHCTARYISVQQLADMVWQDLCTLLTHPESTAQALAWVQGGQWSSQEMQARRELVHKGQVSLDQQIERLTEAHLGGAPPLAGYQRRRGEVEQKQQGLARQAQQVLSQTAQQADVAAQVQGRRPSVAVSRPACTRPRSSSDGNWSSCSSTAWSSPR